MKVVFESKRSLFRLFTIDDAALILELNKDPEVTQFTLNPMVELTQASRVLMDVILPQYRLYNFGCWAVHLKTNNSFIGWCGLKYRLQNDEIDLDYRYKKTF
ncbi:MAG: hypothetical protein C4308_02440 [Chitinophagaceae bacterium]